MVYREGEGLIIRAMREEDARPFSEAFAAQGWSKPESLFRQYVAEQIDGARYALVAERKEAVIGYVTLLIAVKVGPFAGKGIPEIMDLNVLLLHQRGGIGNMLMDTAEDIARGLFDTVGIGVGMHSGYGAAQRMYVKRGYIPDGTGVWYNDVPLDINAPCMNDDDLVLYMTKRLRT